jgi:hypothetical protein
MKNKSKMTTVAVMALMAGTENTNAVKLGSKLASELIVDAEN